MLLNRQKISLRRLTHLFNSKIMGKLIKTQPLKLAQFLFLQVHPLELMSHNKVLKDHPFLYLVKLQSRSRKNNSKRQLRLEADLSHLHQDNNHIPFKYSKRTDTPKMPPLLNINKVMNKLTLGQKKHQELILSSTDQNLVIRKRPQLHLQCKIYRISPVLK